MLDGRINTTKKNTEVTSMENCPEVNAEKAQYMVVSREQNAGQNNNVQMSNKSFETVLTV
jgi:hypothetical protein